MKDKDVLIGKVTTTWGRRGHIKIYPETDFPERFLDMTEISLRNKEKDRTRVYPVQEIFIKKMIVYALLEGVNTISDAEELVHQEVVVSEEEMVELPGDAFYWHQLLGCRLTDTEGNEIGKVKEVLRITVHDILVADCGGKEILIPFVDMFIREVDVKESRIMVYLLPGMKPES